MQTETDQDDLKTQGDTFEAAAASYLGSAQAAKLQKPKKTWFFQRGHGKNAIIIPCEEREAWDICYNKSEWKRHDFILLGTSDGTKYNEVVKEARQRAAVLMPEIEKLQKQITQYESLEEKIMVEDVVDMEDTEDPVNLANIRKIERLHKMIDRTRSQLHEKKEEYRRDVGQVIQRAIEAELKVAKANMKKNGPEYPAAANVATPAVTSQERKKILRLMGHIDQ